MAQQQIPMAGLTIRLASVLTQVTTSLPDGVEGQPYSVQLVVSGGTPPYVFTATTLPPGLNVSQAGLLSGTPTQATPLNSPASVVIDVVDSGQ